MQAYASLAMAGLQTDFFRHPAFALARPTVVDGLPLGTTLGEFRWHLALCGVAEGKQTPSKPSQQILADGFVLDWLLSGYFLSIVL